MGKSLVIVESPTKAKTINKYLGKDFIVKSSVGHVRDLPVSGAGENKSDPKMRAAQAALTRKMEAAEREEYKKHKSQKALVARMGIDPEHGWKAHYEILPGKEKVIDDLKKLAKECDTVYLATDLDREGEAIAWHLREVIGGKPERYKRVVFNEITKNAITEAFKQPGELNMSRVNAQQARRFLDRVVGFMVSPLLWAKIARGLSAGRVQSVAVKLIVDREREIRAFIPEEYWEVFADTAVGKKEKMRMQVTKHKDANFRPNNREQTQAALELLQRAHYIVSKREDKPTQTKPGAPFITSTLQQVANARLGFSVKKTMMMAQKLYESGYITYMRTDSTNISEDALNACRKYITKQFGKAYLPEKPNFYSSKEGAQEAHEAIRPSEVTILHNQLQGMDKDAERLYELIWRRFVASQMPPAEFISTSVVVTAGEFELRARGRIPQFDGFLKVHPAAAKNPEDETLIPDVKVGDKLDLVKLDPSQHFTKPTARYTEASLVRELEKKGIGRPSTVPTVISTIQDRGYVKLENKRFYAEKIGDIVTDRLSESFDDLMDYNFTAQMEEKLDEIAQGKIEWKKILDGFFAEFRKRLTHAEQTGMRENPPTITNIPCKLCERPMMIRTGSTGVFLGCSGYSLPPKERCKGTMNLIHGSEVLDETEDAEVNALRSKKRCTICGTAMEAYLLDENRKLHICGNNPDCAGYEIEDGQFKLKGYDGPSLDCDKCGGAMQLKTGRFGKFFSCTNTECGNTRKLLRSGQPAPPKSDPIPMPELKCSKHEDFFLLRDGAAGLFLAASQFPKHRETRAPLVSEILMAGEKLPEKYQHLLSAPVKDDEGNPAIVRFDRKAKEHYVATESGGKPTGWRATWDNGKWVVEKSTAKKKA